MRDRILNTAPARILVTIAALLVATLPLSAGEGPKVVATFSILGDMVRQVGGERVRLSVLVGPGGDAHVFQPSPADARAVGSADLFIANGLGYEGWLDRLVAAAGFAGPVLVASAGVEARTASDHGREGPDPHAWQDLRNARIYAANIAHALCAVDAEGCAGYEANLATYDRALGDLDAEIRAGLEAIPPARRKIITSHDAFGYFGHAYGIAMIAPVSTSTDVDPTAADVAALVRQIRDQGVTAIFVESIADARLVEQIARDTNARVGGTLYSDSLSPAGGPAPTYLDMMRHNARAMIGALGS